jgi:hypothetical protein
MGCVGSLEERAGASLAEVRVHTGPDSARAAEALGAEAFTVGRDIHFAAGTYDPDSAAGRRLLAHEVAHTIQQRGRPEVDVAHAPVSEPEQAHERHADEFAGLFERSESEPSNRQESLPSLAPTQTPVAPVAGAGTARPSLALAKREPGETASPPLNALAFSSGQPLPAALLRTAEALLGTPLSDVEIHTGDSADEAAETIGARAFTIGPHIFFRNGRYAPHTASGRALLLHELAHVVQWIRGEVPAGANLEVARRGHPLEQEADSLAARLASMFSPAEQMRSVRSPAELDAGTTLRGQRRGGDARGGGMTGLILRESEGDGTVCVAPPTEVPDGGVPVNRPGIVNWDGDTKLRLRASASTTEYNIIEELEFNSRVQVIKKFPGGWLFVSTEGGQLGYVASAYVWTNLPEPNARLHRVEAGLRGTAIAIAEQYYSEYADDWGQDLRFYVNVLAWANKKQVPNNTSGWKKVHFQANELIWIPSQPFARSLKGVVNSGSYTYNTADFLGVADLIERIGQLWDDFARAISLAGQYIPAALARHSLEGLERGLQALIDMLLIAGLVMILATALGAAIGALAGGVGAAPGAAAGFKVGLAVLKWMGLAFLVVWVADALVQIGSAFASFIGTVWGANGNEASLDQAARELAEALGLMVGKIIEGLVMLAAAKGVGFVMGKLAGTRFGQKLGSRFNEWLSQKTKGKGETGKSETGKGETSKSETGKGETSKSETGKGETNKSETGKGETSKSETGKGETSKSETGKGETSKSETGKGEAVQSIGTKVSQKQYRHVEGRQEWISRGKGSYFKSLKEAQAVLDAYHSGVAKVLGQTKQGHIVVQYEGVTGFNNNPGAGFLNQPTNVFMIKGTAAPSVVPTSPSWSPGGSP